MAGDITPAQQIITPEVFRVKAESAGRRLESRLREDLHTGKQTDQLVSFRWEPYEDILNDLMAAFETEQIAGQRHPGRTIEWRKIYQMTKAVPYDEGASDNAPVAGNPGEDICFLALLLGDNDAVKVGRSFSLATRFNIENGAIYFLYKVV